jgi:hypothetical protein
MSRRWGLVLCAIASIASACGGDLPEQSAPRCVAPQNAELERLEGIYEISYFTENFGSCDGEGPSQLEQRPYRGVVVMPSQEARALVLGQCDGADWCHAVASGNESRDFQGPEGFDCSIGDGSLYGKDVYEGSLVAGRCGGVQHVEGFVTPESDGVLRIELKMKAGAYDAPERGCSVAAAEQASATMACTYQVIRMERVEAL